MLDFQERCQLAKSLNVGDVWFNRKTGRAAEVIGRPGRWLLRIRHESGRETTKQEHYFAGDFTPERPTRQETPR